MAPQATQDPWSINLSYPWLGNSKTAPPTETRNSSQAELLLQVRQAWAQWPEVTLRFPIASACGPRHAGIAFEPRRTAGLGGAEAQAQRGSPRRDVQSRAWMRLATPDWRLR